MIAHIMKCSNKYRSKRLHECLGLEIRKDTIFTLSCVFYFLALLYYSNIMKLPSKRDYRSHHAVMLSHWVTNGILCKRFIFLWQNLHLKDEFEKEEEADIEEDECNKMMTSC